ncbi:MAG: glycosyltransferase family 4 protein [Planctomycetota bacterium]
MSAPLRVAFDGAPIDDGPALGSAQAFLTGLRAYAARWPGCAVLLLPDGAQDPGIAGVEVVPAPRGALRRQVVLPRLVRAARAAVLHSPVAAVPLLLRRPKVATVHDLPWLHPDSGERGTRRQRAATTRSLRAADAVLAPSRFTLDAARALVRDPARLHLVPHGAAPPRQPPPAPGDRHGPLLALGDDRPRKNRVRVQAAWKLARRRCPELPELCFAGPPYNVVDDAGKQALLRGCRALVHVSLFEGFGLPVLEGLANGCPVLCSDLPPHREIADDAALFVDPRDPGAIAEGLVRIATDDELRARLAATGPARAARFPPDAVATAWRHLHEELAR